MTRRGSNTHSFPKDMTSVKHDDFTFTETGLLKEAFALANILRGSDVAHLKKQGKIPHKTEVYVPTDRRISVDWRCDGWIPMYSYPFSLGMSFPILAFITEFLQITKLFPGQVSAMIWQVLLGVLAVCKKYNLELFVSDLGYQYDVRPSTPARFSLRSRNKSSDLILNASSSITHISWADRFFFVKRDSLDTWASDLPDRFAMMGTTVFLDEISWFACNFDFLSFFNFGAMPFPFRPPIGRETGRCP